jgi:lysophospholipase L1-like esterase
MSYTDKFRPFRYRVGLSPDDAPIGGILVYVGDSMTAGFGLSSPEFYPTLVAGILGNNWTVHNTAVTGRNVQQMIDAAATEVEPLLNDAEPFNGVPILGATNDIASGESVATVQTRLQTYAADRLEGDVVPVRFACTIPACGLYDATQETRRLTVNDHMRANLNLYGDRLVDFAADPRLQDVFDTDFFQEDRIHPSAGGTAVMAELFLAVLL